MVDALLVAFVLNLLLTPLGCFLVWQRMVFLGDTMAHSAILGVALGGLLRLPYQNLGSVIYLFGFVFLLKASLSKKRQDLMLSLLSYGGMSLGLLLLDKADISHLLFGDILTVEKYDLLVLSALVLVVWGFLCVSFKKLTLYVLDRDLAKQSGINVEKLELVFLLLTATVIAISMRYVGALIVPALLIIPCAAVYKSSKTPQKVLQKALIFGAVLAPLSIFFAHKYNFAIGPSMVCSALVGLLSLAGVQKIKAT